jgi:hypothetical protein
LPIVSCSALRSNWKTLKSAIGNWKSKIGHASA